MQKKLMMTCAALFAAVMLMAATPAAPTPVKPKPAPTMTVMAPAAAPMAVPASMAPVPAMTAMTAAPATQPAPSAKAAAKPDKTGSVVGGALLQILLTVLTIALPIVLTPLVVWLLKKMRVTNLQTQQMVDSIVDQAVVHGLNYANEQAHKLGDNPIKGAEKLAAARDKALAYLKDSGIVNKGAEYIEDLIEAKLGETREDKKPVEPKPEEKPAEDKPADPKDE